MYNFSNNWFEFNRDLWEKLLHHTSREENHILEIGAYEGAATTWFLDNLCEHPHSTVTTIDIFEGDECNNCLDPSNHALHTCAKNLEQRFMDNVRLSHNYPKLDVIKARSSEVLRSMNRKSDKFFNVIYIDGSHIAADVLADAVYSWPLLSTKGFLIFDDYEWNKYKDPYDTPGPAIDSFLECYKPQIEIAHKDYQVVIKKITRSAPYRTT